MTGESTLFTIFALGTCLSAIAVVVSQTVVRMAFWLVISLGSASGLFFLADADFVDVDGRDLQVHITHSEAVAKNVLFIQQGDLSDFPLADVERQVVVYQIVVFWKIIQ